VEAARVNRMPGLKRHRDIVHDDDGEEEIIDVETARSELRKDTVRHPHTQLDPADAPSEKETQAL